MYSAPWAKFITSHRPKIKAKPLAKIVGSDASAKALANCTVLNRCDWSIKGPVHEWDGAAWQSLPERYGRARSWLP
jgi:hypothetical protein